MTRSGPGRSWSIRVPETCQFLRQKMPSSCSVREIYRHGPVVARKHAGPKSMGAIEARPGSGNITTKESFGDMQLHIEFRTPPEVKGNSQGRGNSGVFLMNRYEVQVLDSYQNPTYPDGQCAAFYGQWPPLVNVCRGPGEWQSFDIFFTAPRFADDGTLASPARATVVHNGVLVHNCREFLGPTSHRSKPSYSKHAPTGPISLQDHGNPIRFRNIWVRPLDEGGEKGSQ